MSVLISGSKVPMEVRTDLESISREDSNVKYVCDVFRTLGAIKSSSRQKGPLSGTEFSSVISHIIDLQRLKKRTLLPSKFIEIAESLSKLGLSLPENTIGWRMLMYGNRPIKIMGISVVGGTDGLIKNYAIEQQISEEESTKKIFSKLQYQSVGMSGID